jgi:phospholipid/cholesterol/gamma-HCH transport system substrate-binding protein
MREASMGDNTKRNLRVGLLTAAALGALAVAIVSIGNRQQLFTRHTRYHTSFGNVTGLQQGAQVNLNGVTVGFVERIELPTDPEQQRIVVRFTLDAAYTERIREDTLVSIKTIGLLGDKYLELRGGSPDAERVLEGGMVQGKDPAEVQEFVASGEDLLSNLLAISSSLKVILRRVEAGEGLLGELTSTPEDGERLHNLLNETFTTTLEVLRRIREGEGLVGRLMTDDEMADSLLGDVGGAARGMREVTGILADDLGREGTAYATLLRDPEGSKLVVDTLNAMQTATQALAAAAEELATGEGTLPRLMQDKEYADDFLDDLHGLIANLRSASDKLDQGDGTAGALINDPQMYQDLENVVRGVKSSKVLSWFIRNRRKKGEKVEARELAGQQAREAAPGSP